MVKKANSYHFPSQPPPPDRLFDGIISIVALLLLFGLSWPFLADTTRLAGAIDAAWYTWRTKAILSADPSILLTKHGPFGMLSGGYRIIMPLLGGLLNRIAGVAPERYTIFVIVGAPLLASLALGSFAYRHKGDRAIYLITMVASVGLFLTTPYFGYMDNVTCLFLLASALPFLEPARSMWGPRSAVFLIFMLSMLTHPTTVGIFLLVLLASAGLRWLSFRFDLLKSWALEGWILVSAFGGALAGGLYWKLGLWGVKAGFGEAVLIQPYSSAFFRERLVGWVLSMRPAVTFTFSLIAIAWIAVTWWLGRAEPADRHSRMSILWMLPIVGVFGFVLGKTYPYYRFINPTLAPMLLVGLGMWALVWLARRLFKVRPSGLVSLVLVLAGSFFWYLKPGYQEWSHQRPWIGGRTLVEVTAASAYIGSEPARPVVFILNFDPSSANLWSFVKLAMNTTLGGLSGDAVERTFFFSGTPQDFLSGQPTRSGQSLYDRVSMEFHSDASKGLKRFDADPIVLRLDAFNADTPAPDLSTLQSVTAGVSVVQGQGVAPFSQDGAAAARRAHAAEAWRLQAQAGAFGSPAQMLRCVAGLLLILVLPGLIAARWFGLDDLPARIALIPAISLELVLASGVVVVAIHRAPFGSLDGWASIGIAMITAVVLAVLARSRPNLVAPVQTDTPTSQDKTAP